jgi:hypothetical protein
VRLRRDLELGFGLLEAQDPSPTSVGDNFELKLKVKSFAALLVFSSVGLPAVLVYQQCRRTLLSRRV